MRNDPRILEFRPLAHEAAAFFVGTETGRLLERLHVDPKGRVRMNSQKGSK